MNPKFSEDEMSHALNAGSFLKPLEVLVERAGEHPLLRHAVVAEGPAGTPHVTWPGFTKRQIQVAGECVKVYLSPHRHKGAPYFSVNPRVNADWFLPSNPTRDHLRLRLGTHEDLPRWYLVIDPVPNPCQVTLLTAFTVEGERQFFARAHRAGWASIAADHFVGMRENPDLVMVATDKIAADSWEQIWKVRTGG
jgi:hypothetical protein